MNEKHTFLFIFLFIEKSSFVIYRHICEKNKVKGKYFLIVVPKKEMLNSPMKYAFNLLTNNVNKLTSYRL